MKRSAVAFSAALANPRPKSRTFSLPARSAGAGRSGGTPLQNCRQRVLAESGCANHVLSSCVGTAILECGSLLPLSRQALVRGDLSPTELAPSASTSPPRPCFSFEISNGLVDFLTQRRAAAHFLGTTSELCHPERSVPTLFPAKIASFRFSRRDAQSRDLSSSLSKTEDLNRAIPNLKSVSSARLCPGGRS